MKDILNGEGIHVFKRDDGIRKVDSMLLQVGSSLVRIPRGFNQEMYAQMVYMSTGLELPGKKPDCESSRHTLYLMQNKALNLCRKNSLPLDVIANGAYPETPPP